MKTSSGNFQSYKSVSYFTEKFVACPEEIVLAA